VEKLNTRRLARNKLPISVPFFGLSLFVPQNVLRSVRLQGGLMLYVFRDFRIRHSLGRFESVLSITL
jgi:hypothetical protein